MLCAVDVEDVILSIHLQITGQGLVGGGARTR